MSLKVTYILGRFPVRTEYPVLHEIAAVALLGVRPEIVAFHPANDPIPAELAHLEAHVHYLDAPLNLVRLRGRTAAMRKRCARLARLLEEHTPEIVHPQFGHLGLMLAADAPAPLVLSFRGQDVLLVRREPEPVRSRLFDRAKRVLTRCEAMRNDLIEMGCPEEKVFVLPTGVFLSHIPFRERTAPSPGEPVRVLFVGRDVPKKGRAAAEQAVAALRPQYPVALQCVHDQPHDEVIQAMMESHLFVLPSRIAPDGDKEGIPNAIKEAMASGLPVVSTSHAGIPECVEHGRSGLLVNEEDSRGLRDNLAWMMAHPERWPAMGRRGREIVEQRYDIASVAPELLRHYHAVINRID